MQLTQPLFFNIKERVIFCVFLLCVACATLGFKYYQFYTLKSQSNPQVRAEVLLQYTKQKNNKIYFAGQITGVEGYVESISSGFVAGINLANEILGKSEFTLPKETVMGALVDYVSTKKENFQVNIDEILETVEHETPKNKKNTKEIEVAKETKTKTTTVTVSKKKSDSNKNKENQEDKK